MTRGFPSVRLIRFAAVIALTGVVALPETCLACSCALPLLTPIETSTRAVAVFRGTVTGVETVRAGRTTFRVSTAWKGNVTSEMVVYSGSVNNSCSFRFQQGVEYVVYADRSATGNFWGAPENSLVAVQCGRTAPVNQASADLAALGPGQPPAPEQPSSQGHGVAALTGSSLVLGMLAIVGSLLAFLAIAWRARTRPAAINAARHR